MSPWNRKVVLANPIKGLPRAENFRVIETPMPVPGNGELLLRHIYLSLDPYQRPAIAGTHLSSAAPLDLQAAPAAETVSQVVISRHSDVIVGDYVRHFGGWQEFSVAAAEEIVPLDPHIAPLSAHLGVLGMPGLTAYASMIELADVTAGQAVLVSAAAGPVGSMVGQLAMQMGATAFGIAGSAQKCGYVIDELGFADCINYRDDDYPQSLRRRVARDIDIYHDNVGGQMLLDALSVLRNYGIIVLCGLISQYNMADEDRRGIDLAGFIKKRAVMKGLVVYDYEDRRQAFLDLVGPWVRSRQVRYREDRVHGIENTAIHFEKLMRGQNFGKTLVVVGPESMAST